jgi:DNA-directed RNA polymerase sigma subunit (sigma70/sigma32)
MTYRVDSLQRVKDRRWEVVADKNALLRHQFQFASSVRRAYAEGATLQQLADATGLTRQRIQQIVSERGDR